MEATDWIALSLAFYLAVACGVGLRARLRHGLTLYEPLAQYLLFVSLFTIPLPVRAILSPVADGHVSPHLPRILPYLAPAVVLSALSIPMFALGYHSRLPGRIAARVPVPPRGTATGALAAAAGIGLLATALILLLVRQSGGLLAFLLLGYGASAEMVGRGYLAAGFPWLFVASLFLLYAYAVRRNWATAAAFVAAVTVVAGIHLALGDRTRLLYFAVATVVFVHFAIRRIPGKVLLPLGLAGFLALNAVGLVRSSGYSDVAQVAETFTSGVSGAVGDDRRGLVYTITEGEFVVPFETLPEMIRTVGVTETPWVGLSFLRTPAFLVPSPLYPDRPLPLANWYMRRFYGEGFAANEGRQFFFLSEGYLNFGPMGVLLLAWVWGVGWGALYRWMRAARANPGTVLIYALAVAYMFRAVAGDAVTLVVAIPQQALVIAVVGLVVATGFGRWSPTPQGGEEA